MKRIYLVDVSSLFFRAFYAIRSLNNSAGLPTNALYGFLASIVKLLKEHQPYGIAFCFDRPEPGFREELYEDYKANRDEAPDDLQKQFPYLPRLADALNIPKFEVPGFEADDVIGTLAEQCHAHGYEVIIVSGDKDFGQLVKHGVKIYDPSKDLYTDPLGVEAKLGVKPNQVIDYLALVGDSSDNVPGIAGIGPKGAQKLLQEFGSLDEIYKSIDKVANPKLKQKLIEQKDKAYLSQKLVTIRLDAPIKATAEDLKIRPVDRAKLVPLLEELGFKGFLQRLLGEGGQPAQPKESDAAPALVSQAPLPQVEASTLTKSEEVVGFLSSSEDIWLDISARGIAISDGQKHARFEGELTQLKSALEQLGSQKPLKWSGYSVKETLRQLQLDPKVFQNIAIDVELAAYCLGRGEGLELSELIKTHLGQTLPEFGQPELSLKLIQDLGKKVMTELDNIRAMKVYEKLELPLAPILYEMEWDGFKIDTDALNQYSVELAQESSSLEKIICSMAGMDFNLGSPKQLSQVLFDKLGLKPVRKTKTGYSTDSDVLEKLMKEHPICAKILEWRELTKLRSTYVDALPRLVDHRDHRIHTHFYQAVTSTGRLSSANPNLQNIPIRTPRGSRIRKSFIADQGNTLISLDYSQIELRILAHIAQDESLIKAFEEDLDIHSATAAEVFGVKLGEVTDDQRRAAKAINFGIAYGMNDFGLAERLDIERSQAAEFIKKYFARFSGVQKYMHEIVEKGKAQGYVETVFGRRRYYDDLKSSNGRVRQMAERAVINMPIQGAAADLMKLAMIAVHRKIKESGTKARMILQVHDELVFEAPKELAHQFGEQMKVAMETVAPLRVPLKVSMEIGDSWGD
ncbi:MAG: DNA polymerase I [Oligoflexia bacterium]|nr:DNA polymerase I [Oligoflexia bacterium]